MGFRLSIRSAGSKKWYGDDHKLYGYFDYDIVRKSFDYLVPFIVRQWKGFKDLSQQDTIEAYERLAYLGYTEDLVLNKDEFKTFSEYYISDMMKAGLDDILINNAKEYFKHLCKTSSDKILEWG